MNKVTTTAAVVTSPVAVATILTAVANKTSAPTAAATGIIPSKVNTQVSSKAPDASGKNMTQFEALVGAHSAAYCSTNDAERACMEAAHALGMSNYISVVSDPNAYRLLAW